jgi:hypothetical protein
MAAAAFGIGCLVWAVPLVALTGGIRAYWHALFSQGAEDLAGIQMLWTMPTVRELLSALYYAFVAPWARWELATIALALAAAGAVRGHIRCPRSLQVVAVAFVPYLLFDILFQETFTTRYALPLIVPIAYLAALGAESFGGTAGVIILVVFAMVNAHVGGTSVAAYARHPAPAFQMLDDMRITSSSGGARPILAADRRESLDLRRPLLWVGDATARFAAQLPAPPKHEWLQLEKYWNDGGRAPVWMIVDPKRTEAALFDRPEPHRYRWSVPYPVLLGGVRPNEMDWYQFDRPEWYVGEGWALTPEAAGVAGEDHRGPGVLPIHGWIRRRSEAMTMVVGGRNLGSGSLSHIGVSIDEHALDGWDAPPGFFLRLIDVPAADDQQGSGYEAVTVAADSGAVAIEQFDAQPASVPVFGFGTGWQEQEYDGATGRRWRWLSEGGQLQLRNAARPLVLHLEGESPRKYFSRPSRVLVRAGNRVLLDRALGGDFSLDVPIPPAQARDETLTIETDQVFIPAERSRRTGDHRHLGLRIFTCTIRPA